MAALKLSRWLGIGLLSVLTSSPGWTLELNGQSYFTQTPWRVEFTNYDWIVDAGGPEYYSRSRWPRTREPIWGAW